LPREVVNEFDDLISRVAAQGDRRALLEHFKSYFCRANGAPHIGSSDEGWAYTDLMSAMEAAVTTPALFLEAFYDACDCLRSDEDNELEVPDVDLINEVCREHGVPYQIQPPRLVRTTEPVRVSMLASCVPALPRWRLGSPLRPSRYGEPSTASTPPFSRHGRRNRSRHEEATKLDSIRRIPPGLADLGLVCSFEKRHQNSTSFL
jgi:hypothetical protein